MANSGAKLEPSGPSTPLPRIASALPSGSGGRSRFEPAPTTITVSAVSCDCSAVRMNAPQPPSAQPTPIVASELSSERIRATASPRPAPPIASLITNTLTPDTSSSISQLMLSARTWYCAPLPTSS